MSYDLQFLSKSINSKPSKENVFAFFENRNYYKISNDQAIYQNEDTGVYFIFEYEQISEEELAENPFLISFTLLLNVFRPHIFGHESALEIESFVNHFDLNIQDLQIDGMGVGPFSRECFINSWDNTNKIGYESLLPNENPEDLNILLTAQIHNNWNWNYKKAALQNSLGESIFVPRISFFKINGSLLSTIVWTDNIPAILPIVDGIIAPRMRLKRKKLFGSKNPDFTFLKFNDILPHISNYEKNNFNGIEGWKLSYSTAPGSLDDYIRNLPEIRKDYLIPVSVDKILNKEIIDQVNLKKKGGA